MSLTDDSEVCRHSARTVTDHHCPQIEKKDPLQLLTTTEFVMD